MHPRQTHGIPPLPYCVLLKFIWNLLWHICFQTNTYREPCLSASQFFWCKFGEWFSIQALKKSIQVLSYKNKVKNSPFTLRLILMPRRLCLKQWILPRIQRITNMLSSFFPQRLLRKEKVSISIHELFTRYLNVSFFNPKKARGGWNLPEGALTPCH